MTTEAITTFAGCSTSTVPLGLGTWAWGDTATWGMGGYDTTLDESTIADAWDATLDAGVGLIDTAEVYGGGESERIIGRLLARTRFDASDLVLATKFMPMPHKLNVAKALRQSLLASLDRLGVERVDLYQIHGPISLRSHGAMADALAAVHAEGLVSAVGVSNYSIREMGAIHAELAARGLALASNQIEFSLLRRRPESNGLLGVPVGTWASCRSPTRRSARAGSPASTRLPNPPPGKRGFSDHPMEKVDRWSTSSAASASAHDGTDAEPGRAALDHREGRRPDPRAPRTASRPSRTPARWAGR